MSIFHILFENETRQKNTDIFRIHGEKKRKKRPQKTEISEVRFFFAYTLVGRFFSQPLGDSFLFNISRNNNLLDMILYQNNRLDLFFQMVYSFLKLDLIWIWNVEKTVKNDAFVTLRYAEEIDYITKSTIVWALRRWIYI